VVIVAMPRAKAVILMDDLGLTQFESVRAIHIVGPAGFDELSDEGCLDANVACVDLLSSLNTFLGINVD
jgi:hypothetical protein